MCYVKIDYSNKDILKKEEKLKLLTTSVIYKILYCRRVIIKMYSNLKKYSMLFITVTITLGNKKVCNVRHKPLGVLVIDIKISGG